jgi:hypothetical protein
MEVVMMYRFSTGCTAKERIAALCGSRS